MYCTSPTSGSNIDEMIISMNHEVKKLITWLNINKLSLNVVKTHYIIFSPGRKIVEPSQSVYVDDQRINRVVTTKFLGVMMDEKLSWKQHTLYINKKICKNVGILCSAKKYFCQKLR